MNKRVILGILVFSLILSICNLSLGAEREKKEEIYKQMELFSDAFVDIQSDYVEEKSPKDLIYGALKGMLSSLDPHSQFLTPNEYKELREETKGEFGGLGMEITIKDGLLTIVTPLEDTPAWRVGVKPGDRIVKIDGEPTRDITLLGAMRKLRGKPGTEVSITVLREPAKEFLDFKITRDIIKIKDIKDVLILEDKIGFIRLVEFRENTPQDFEKELKRLIKEGCDSLILDLRNNPGGLLDVAVKITQLFLEPNRLIVSTRGRKKNQNIEFKSKYPSPFLDISLVILVNSGSASGSEIVSGCLQDYRRAIILGEKTFGKGSVQTLIPLSDGSALRLTTSKYFTPKEREIHSKGISPDIIIEEREIEIEPKEKSEDVFERLLEERELKRLPEKYSKDLQLLRAIDIIKAIKLYREGAKSNI